MIASRTCPKCATVFTPKKAKQRYCSIPCYRVKHGQAATGTPEYEAWRSMLQRCRNPKNKHFHRYGGRGIRVCERWVVFENFAADMGPRPGDGFTLERKDNDGDYEPGNCEWATRAAQGRNRSTSRLITFNGETKSLAEWARSIGVTKNCLYGRLDRAWPIERALAEPPTTERTTTNGE